MVKGTPGEFYRDKYIGGYFNDDGVLVVCEEYGLSDADTGNHFDEVQNGYGYYDDNGKFHRYSSID